MPAVEIKAGFKCMSYIVEIDTHNYDGVSFESTAATLLAQAVRDDMPEGCDEDDIPTALGDYEAWRVFGAYEMPQCLVGEGGASRLGDLETAFNVENDDSINFDAWCAWCDSDGRIHTKNEYYARYHGTFNNEGDYAEELLDDCLGFRNLGYDMVRCYIDYEGMERDMALNGDIVIIEHGGYRHIFRKG